VLGHMGLAILGATLVGDFGGAGGGVTPGRKDSGVGVGDVRW